MVIGKHWDIQASRRQLIADAHRHRWKESGASPGLCSVYRSNENLD